MNYETLINALDITTIEKMKHALETGKWADGNPLSAQEQERCMQLILAFEQQHQPDKDLEADYNPRKQTPCASKQSASNMHIEQPLIHIKK
ncbi:hypothetical protein PsalN5692_02973 [Piscirickettsia salmonis]|uniref:DUF1315 family protein n=1 Tax=Piscirickettsia salmonis TaxID=1238 RepID=UPI0012B91C05|nr:DUF1315 family protein [Piscirickettsia salmonis]QGP51489.1 hypothetical protein PsalN5692_02973 [Piscirickettsia salmonis]QGP53328.1 hypothetical protein PsalSR1_00736 [Piscirickettsia salmonis]QGP60754.1 hypothetical protein PsalBI1_03375 [Piscirickettsia salmonis]QGP62893.1 hypothetical protein PsalMR5_00734 [Piscirickettsia salmonis]